MFSIIILSYLNQNVKKTCKLLDKSVFFPRSPTLNHLVMTSRVPKFFSILMVYIQTKIEYKIVEYCLYFNRNTNRLYPVVIYWVCLTTKYIVIYWLYLTVKYIVIYRVYLTVKYIVIYRVYSTVDYCSITMFWGNQGEIS